MSKPRLGQHFLIDARYLTPMLQAAELKASEAVIEVGPGKGILTKALLKCAGHVVAVELDEKWAMRLQERLGHYPQLRVQQQDARKIHWASLVQELKQQGYTQVKLVANLPYYLATQLILQALAAQPGCDCLVVMVQEEVAQRMCAEPGKKHFSAYSVALQYYGLPHYVASVPAKAFQPPPKVSSAIVRIERRLEPPVQVTNVEQFFYWVHALFTHRRKTLRNCLQGTLGAPPIKVWEAILQQADIHSQRRPETLHLPELAKLANLLDTFTLASKNDSA